MFRVMRPGGVLAFDTITRSPVSYVLVVVLAELFGVTPRNSHDWSFFITPEEMAAVLTDSGFVTSSSSYQDLRPSPTMVIELFLMSIGWLAKDAGKGTFRIG